MKRLLALLLLSPLTSFASQHFPAYQAQVWYPTPGNFFESPEHLDIGDSVKLIFSANEPGQAGIKLHLPNGLTLTYGEIVTFGDYYEVPLHPISLASTTEEQTQRFQTGFNSFATDPNVVNEATQILTIIHTEEKTVQDAVNQGESPEAAYAAIAWDINRQLNCATGGGCSSAWWTNEGRFLTLAKMDYDHFGDGAILSYKIGHDAAMQQAIIAGKTHDRSQLEVAYAMNAFACHFLSDRFAAGHIRTPRVELATQVTPEVAGSLLSSFMHNEENAYGLHVHNAQNEHWVIYGDRSYLDEQSTDNRRIINEAMQLSAQQIFDAYQTGEFQSDDAVLAYVPQADEIGDQANLDVAPLFYIDTAQQKIYRRVDMNNVYDHHWTANWWGWSTLAELSRERGLPPVYKRLISG